MSREAGQSREARRRAQQDEAKALDRFAAFLQLQLSDGREPPGALTVFRSLGKPESNGRLHIEIGEPFRLWSHRISAFYEQSRHIFLMVDNRALLKERPRIEQMLKSVAVELMTSGVELRGITTDAVPLVAYSLFNGRLPVSPGADSPAIDELVNDLFLSVADEAAAMPVDSRRLLVGMLRIAVLFGEAQAYSEQLGLTSLSIS